jgi:hypothetical protein
MAHIHLDRDEAERGELPPVCVRCGAGADVIKPRGFHWYPRWAIAPLMRLALTRRMTVQLPLCEVHANEWSLYNGPGKLWGLRVTEITPDGISLAGVHDDFAEALDDYRDGRGPKRWYTGGLGEGEFRERAPRRRASRAAPPRPASLTWLWVLLGVLFLGPVLLAGAFLLVALVALQRGPANRGPVAFAPPAPPAGNVPQAPGAGGARPEVVAAALACAPEGPFPGNVPWGALAVLCGKEGPGRPAEADLDRVLADLRSPRFFTAADAARRLAEMPPAEPRRPEVARALEPLLTRRELPAREAGARALAVWGTPESVPALVKLLDDPFPPAREQALAALAALKDPQAAEPVARRLSDSVTREKAVQTLQALGPPAEKAVLPYLKERDPQTRAAACRALETIGTKESLAPLEEAARDQNPAVAQAARSALTALGKRP